MGVLIDATVLADHARGRLDLDARVAGREHEAFFVSVITASELLHAVQRADRPEAKTVRSVFVEALIERFPLLPVDLPTARIHAELRAEVRRSGVPVGADDLWLAAAALAHGLSLATTEARHLDRVAGLKLEVWG